jgi:hypothetical protein
MRQALLGILAVLAARSTQAAETYTFTAILQKLWSFQTTIYCVEPVKLQGRVPQRGCTLSERAIAYPNLRNVRGNHGVVCAAGHPIAFHPNGALAYCKLESEQGLETARAPWVSMCFDYVTFDENGFADCDRAKAVRFSSIDSLLGNPASCAHTIIVRQARPS